MAIAITSSRTEVSTKSQQVSFHDSSVPESAGHRAASRDAYGSMRCEGSRGFPIHAQMQDPQEGPVLRFDHLTVREDPDMPTRRASNEGTPRGLRPSMPLLIAMTCTLAIAGGAAHGQSPDSSAGAGESTGEISFIEMIKQANRQYEQKVSGAIARGEFDQAREHVKELETVIPGSPQVAKLTTMIDKALGATALAERKVRGRDCPGGVSRRQSSMCAELASITPDSPRPGEMQKEVDQARATATVVEQEVLEAIARGEFAIAQEYVQELAGVIPKSPRVAEMEAKVGQGAHHGGQSWEHEVSVGDGRGRVRNGVAIRRGAEEADSGVAAGEDARGQDRGRARGCAACAARGVRRNRPW